MAEKLYLAPGNSFGKKGLPGNKIVSKAGEYKELTETQIKVMEKNIPGLKLRGIVLTASQVAELEKSEEGENKKSDKRVALEKEATELEIEFTDKTSQKDLSAAIEAKKSAPKKEEDK